MNGSKLIRAMSGLLLATAVLHVLSAFFGALGVLKLPMIAFGLIYGALGLFVQSGQRLAVVLTLLVTGLGLTGAVMMSLQGRLDVSAPLLVMFFVEVGIVVAGLYWLLEAKKPSA
jgi:hypothetical protein